VLLQLEPAPCQQVGEKVLLLYHAERMTEVAAARDDDTRIGAVGDLARHRVGRIIEIDPVHIRARRHDGRDRAVGQRQHAVDHLLLDLVDHPGLGALGDGEAHFLFGDAIAATFRNAQQLQDYGRRALENPREGPADACNDLQRPRHAHGDRFRRSQRHAFGDEFADDHRHRRDADHHEGDRDGRPMRRDTGHLVKHRSERRAQRGTAECARQDADERDADLHGRQETAGLIGEGQRMLGARLALGRHLLQPQTARRHHRHFRHGKKAIEQEQHHQDGKVDDDFHRATLKRLREGTFGPDSRSRI
jgi:hypothetical protein